MVLKKTIKYCNTKSVYNVWYKCTTNGSGGEKSLFLFMCVSIYKNSFVNQLEVRISYFLMYAQNVVL